jgi:hypothetical protein
MKVFWSSRKGAVICSANVSANALGRGGLKEAGVWLPRGSVNIQGLLRYANPQPIREADLRALAKQSDRFDAARPRSRAPADDESPSLREWLASGARKEWKVGWWDIGIPVPKVAKEESRERYGVRGPADYILCREAAYRSSDWVLTFDVSNGKHLAWMYVDFVVKVARSDKRTFDRRYPYVAVQVHRLQMNPASPPFKIDVLSRNVVSAAVQEVGVELFERMKTGRIPAVFRRSLVKHSQLLTG